MGGVPGRGPRAVSEEGFPKIECFSWLMTELIQNSSIIDPGGLRKNTIAANRTRPVTNAPVIVSYSNYMGFSSVL
jgi:hypothetical protein